MQRLNDAVIRVLSLKAKLNQHREHLEHSKERESFSPDNIFDPDRHVSLQQSVAEQSITLCKDTKKTLPLQLQKGNTVAVCRLPDEPVFNQSIGLELEERGSSPLKHLMAGLKKRGFNVIEITTPQQLEDNFEQVDALIYTASCVPSAFRGSIKCSRRGQEFINPTWITSHKPVIFISEGSPYTHLELASMPCVVLSYSSRPHLQDTVLKAIFGESPFLGVCPVKLPSC
jgi:hypothetical protein